MNHLKLLNYTSQQSAYSAKSLIESKEVLRKKIKKNGAVYTPSSLAKFVTDKTMGYLLEEEAKNLVGKQQILNFVRRLRILDPACGEGDLLFAAMDSLRFQLLNKCKSEIPFDTDLVETLCGIDLDSEALAKLGTKIGNYFPGVQSDRKQRENLMNANALFPFASLSPLLGWEKIKEAFRAKKGFDLVIANPPWGADMQSYETKFQRGDYELYRGQCDTSDLFVELIMSITKKNGFFALIIPDSLFNGGREPLRKLLLKETEIKFIGRMGEKIFPNVNRGCAVVICKNTIPSGRNSVESFRLLPSWKKKILNGDCSFEEVVSLFAHKVPQQRFTKNAEHLFDIDLRREEVALLKRIGTGVKLKDFITSYRGVELSKTGQVCQCSSCNKWMPMPTSDNPHCNNCGHHLNYIIPSSIVSKTKKKGYVQLLAGENFSRYKINSILWIDNRKEGINYKDNEIYRSPKIIIRKTGVSITATMDYSNALTNQVVYMLKPIDNKMNIPMEAFLAILNSRVMAYFLLKKFGEAEWRSHPYLTQEQILNLPVPKNLSSKKRDLQFIANTLKPILRSNREVSMEIEAKLERRIARLYGINEKDYHAMYKSFELVEDLLPFRRLKALDVCGIF